MTKSRGLRSVKRKIGDINEIIDNILENQKKVTILELGTGYGNSIMGLSKKYKKSQLILYGMNLKKKHGIIQRSDFIKHALSFRVIRNKDLKNIAIPNIIIGDAGKKIPLPSNSIDFVYSITTFFFIPNKSHAIEELYRVLKPHGIAIIHFKHYVKDFPKEYRNLFVIKKGRQQIDVVKYLRKFKNYGINIRKTKKKGTDVLLIEKNKRHINLGLKFIKKESLSLQDLGYPHFATRSYFEVKKHENK